jgi:hypothetical protein
VLIQQQLVLAQTEQKVHLACRQVLQPEQPERDLVRKTFFRYKEQKAVGVVGSPVGQMLLETQQ